MSFNEGAEQQETELQVIRQGGSDEIWIKREGTASARRFNLSRLPPHVYNIAGLRDHMKDLYKEDYTGVTDDNIIVGNNSTGAPLRADVKLADLTGNTYDTPYPVKVKGLYSDLFSLMSRVIFNEVYESLSIKGATQRLLPSLLHTGLSSSHSSHLKASSYTRLEKTTPSSADSLSISPKISTQWQSSLTSHGGGMDGGALRKRVVVAGEEEIADR
ncbi:hypothetical protein MP638_002382 [Amoeboaphelidium occidentale]|nr:hypothetical protein MP638_002382 [Amoeboaphelidium occidentale]